MDFASNQRLVKLTGGRIARAWIAAWQQVRDANPPAQIAQRLHSAEPITGIRAALTAYAVEQHNAFTTAGQAVARWLGDQLTAPAPVAKKLLSFDPADDDVMSWAERNRLDLVDGLDLEQRSLIRAELSAMLEDGTNPLQAAREIWESIGLTPAQEAAVRGYRLQLERGQYTAALQRELSSGASDRAIAAAARAERKLTAAQIDTAVSRYRQNYQRLRTETILRTEGARIANQASDAALQQAIGRGDVGADQLEQTWYHSPSADSKHEFHAVMHGQVRAWGEPFVSGLGAELHFPCDPQAPAKETVNCRCARAIRVRSAARAQAA